MKKVFTLLFTIGTLPFLATSQNVGVDVTVPDQKLDVAGAIKLGSTTNGVEGSIRWNGLNFQVHNGTQWINFGTGTDNDWAVVGNDMYSEPTGNVGIGIALPVAKFQVVGSSRLSSLNINGNYSFPTIDGSTGFVLTTNGSGAVSWSNPALVGDITSVVAGAGLINGGTSGDVTLDVNPGDGIVITSDEVRVRASDLEGDGLSVTGNDFNVNVDNSTVELNADALRVKAEGITANEIATGAVTTDEILNGTILTGDISVGGVTSSNILNSTILPADIANAGNEQVLVTDASGVPTWQNQTTLFGGQAGDGLVNDVPNSEIDVNPGDGIAVTGDQVVVVASDLEGNGLSVTTNNFNVNVDNTTIEINADALRLKADGIQSAHIAPDVIVAADIATGAVTTTEILNATILPADVAAGSNNTVLSTNASGVVGWNNPATLTTVLQDVDADTKITVDVANADEDHIRLSTLGAERMTIDNAGEVGIGTNTPDRTLHVTAPAGGVLIVTRNDATTTSGETLGEIQFDSEASTNPSAVEASAVIRGIASETHGNSNKGGHLAFATKSGGGVSGAAPASERMRITNLGNVGIGIATPDHTLDVVGNVEISTLAGSGNRVVQADASGTLLVSNNLPSGDADYIWNGTSTQGANWRISGYGIAENYLQTPILYDHNSTTYRWDGSGTTVENVHYNHGTFYMGSSAGDGDDMYLADRIYDWDNSSYYLDPSGTSVENVHYNYGTFYMGSSAGDGDDMYLADRIYDWDNTGYYLDPASTSRMGEVHANRVYGFNDVRSPIFYDYNDTYYYTDPNGSQRYNGQMEIARTTGYTYVANSQSWGYCNTCTSSSFGCCSSNWWGCTGYCSGTNCSICGQTIYSKMRVNGGIYSYAYWSLSDKKYKKDVSTIPHAMSLIKQVRGVSYKLIDPNDETSNYDENPDMGDDYLGPQIGFIAQELQAILPQLVHEEEVETPEGGKETQIGVAYGQMTALLVEGMKEQQKMIDELKAEIALMKSGSTDRIKSETELDIEKALEQMVANKHILDPEHQAEMMKFMDEIRNAKTLTNTQRMILQKMRKKFDLK